MRIRARLSVTRETNTSLESTAFFVLPSTDEYSHRDNPPPEHPSPPPAKQATIFPTRAIPRELQNGQGCCAGRYTGIYCGEQDVCPQPYGGKGTRDMGMQLRSGSRCKMQC